MDHSLPQKLPHNDLDNRSQEGKVGLSQRIFNSFHCLLASGWPAILDHNQRLQHLSPAHTGQGHSEQLMGEEPRKQQWDSVVDGHIAVQADHLHLNGLAV